MLKYVAEEIASVATNITGYAIIITDDKGIVIGADSENSACLISIHYNLNAKVQLCAHKTKKNLLFFEEYLLPLHQLSQRLILAIV